MADIRLRRGDTILGLYNDMYPDLPEREKRKLLEKWEAENFVDPNRVKAGATYFFPKSNYGEQVKLKKEIAPTITAADLLDVETARNRLITGGEKTVNALLIAQGRKGSFRMPTGGLSHAQAKSIAKMSGDEILAQIIELQNLADDLDTVADYKEWYRSMELPREYYDKAEQAFIDQKTAIRQEGTAQRAKELHPGAKTIQSQTIAKGNQRKIERGDQIIYQERADANSAWVDVSTAPRWQDKVPEVKQFYEGGKVVFKQFDPEDGIWKKVEGTEAAPRWQATDAAPTYRTIKRGEKEILQNWDKDRKVWVDADEAPRWQDKEAEKSAKHRNWEEWVIMENARRREADAEAWTATELSNTYKKYVLTTQEEVKAFQPKALTELMNKKESFMNTSGTIKRMLTQLANPDVLLGGIGDVVSGFANITGQWTQLAATLGEKKLLDHELYDWGSAAESDQLKGNITALAYSLARAAEDSGGRLAESDVRMQVERLTGSLQSKSRFAAALAEVHNETLHLMRNKYRVSKDAGVPGTERDWEEFLAYAGTGPLLPFTHKGQSGIGYYIWVVDEKGNKKRKMQPVAMWKK